MNERLGPALTAAVSVWLDQIRRAERSRPASSPRSSTSSSLRGVTSNPSIFQKAILDGERLRRRGRASSPPRADVDRGHLRHHRPTTSARRADVLRPVFDATDGDDGCVSIEVSPGLAHDTEQTVAEAASSARPSASPNVMIKIPGTTEGWPAIDRDHRRGHQRQRHADLRPRAVRATSWRPTSPGSSRPPTTGTSRRHPLRRLVLRLARRHRDRQAPRGPTRAPAPTRTCAARPASPTPGSRSRCSRSSSPARAGRRSRPRAPASSGRCGPRPASRTPTTTTRCTSSTWSSRTPSTRCRRRPWRPSPTTARCAVTGSARSTTTPPPTCRRSPRPGSTTTT